MLPTYLMFRGTVHPKIKKSNTTICTHPHADGKSGEVLKM